jgi:hypothetical protein
MRWRIRRGATGRCGRCAATTACRCPRPACCGCCARRGCCWRRTTSGNAVGSRPGGRLRSGSSRPARTRCGSWTSPSSRPPPAGRGGWPAAGTTGRSTNWGGTSRRRPTSTTPIAAVELALIEAEQLAGTRLVDLAPRDADGNVEPLITSVTDIQTRWRSDDVRSARCGSSPVGGSARPRADADPARRVVPTPSRCSRPPPRVRRAATSRRRGERGEHARPDHRSQPDHHGVAGPQTPQEAGLVAHRSSSRPAGAPGRQVPPTAVVVPSGWTTRAARWPRPVSQRAASGPRA